jgi:hypothetical protein
MLNLLTAVALLLILEGLLPFLAPAVWRTAMRRIGSLADGQIRFFGLAAIVAGAGLLLVL